MLQHSETEDEESPGKETEVEQWVRWEEHQVIVESWMPGEKRGGGHQICQMSLVRQGKDWKLSNEHRNVDYSISDPDERIFIIMTKQKSN